jgi:hypothetical protein
MLVHGTNGGKSDACPRRPSPPDTSLARHWEVALPRAAYHLAAVSEKERPRPDEGQGHGADRRQRIVFGVLIHIEPAHLGRAHIRRRQDTDEIRFEIAAPGCRLSVRRSTEPNCPHPGQENVSQGKPPAIAAPMVG